MMTKGSMREGVITEADTCREFVTPRLIEAGWSASPHAIGEQRTLKAQQQAHEQAAKAAQAEGDALYWPIYNLDLKNPHAKAGLEHANPKDLIARMRGHETEVMRLLGEIEVVVNEVQA